MSFVDQLNTLLYSLWNQGLEFVQANGIENPELVLVASLAALFFMSLLLVSFARWLLSRPGNRHDNRLRYNLAQMRRQAPFRSD